MNDSQSSLDLSNDQPVSYFSLEHGGHSKLTFKNFGQNYHDDRMQRSPSDKDMEENEESMDTANLQLDEEQEGELLDFIGRYPDDAQELLYMRYKYPDSYSWSIKDFQIGRPIGRGKFGRVYLARERITKFIVALKIMDKQMIVRHNHEEQLRREIEIHANLDHPNILKLYHYFWDEKRIYMVIEYCPGGELYKDMKSKPKQKYDEATASRYIYQVCRGLKYLHSQNVIHRDLKPENLLNSFGNIKVADFGWSIRIDKEKRKTLCGTLDYLPPEIVSRDPHDTRADIWCLGILCYEFCVGKPPFEHNDRETTKSNILEGKLKFPEDLSWGVKDLIQKILKPPDYRLSLDEILAHEWILKYNREPEYPQAS
eukprot:CAMPEP_0115015158 /NCGR_PEP_ID=MMETSP0216-20121206/26573_1 /TAXON_ID=223996 /ORGANISM="Protocruzia adherens, Strain Boccale" /LENGTH=369 /DNA_ID=CAMNT_0002385167 /DNA_START=119 /DNA_END=1228 /DNA_ORIENTATION=+